MASRKRRAAGNGADTSADNVNSSVSGRVKVQVGGETFITTRATLEPASAYFARLFATEWSSGAPDEELFLDRDPDVFRVLLSFMRSGKACVLPQGDQALFSRVLLDAEFLGIDSLIEQVKVRVQKHLNPLRRITRTAVYGLSKDESDEVESKWTAEAFDKEHGGLHEALETTWFMERFFNPEPTTLYPKIVQLIAAKAGERVVISGGYHYGAQPKSRSVRAYALVEERAGLQSVVPMVATNGDDCRDQEEGEDADDVRLNDLELVTEIDDADVYGWHIEGNKSDVKPHGRPNGM